MTTTVIVKPNHGPHLKAEAVLQRYSYGDYKDGELLDEQIRPCPLGQDTILYVTDAVQVTVREVAAE